jgi:hypothetical protein
VWGDTCDWPTYSRQIAIKKGAEKEMAYDYSETSFEIIRHLSEEGLLDA